MFDKEVKILRFMQGYGDMLLGDIEPQDMCLQPTPGCNHPAWLIGHLAIATDAHSEYAGSPPQLQAWRPMFGMGTSPQPSVEGYPAKDELMQAWHAANERLISAATSASPEMLNLPTEGPLAEVFPKVSDFLAFSMTGHTSMHLGQLSAWRRAAGRPPLF